MLEQNTRRKSGERGPIDWCDPVHWDRVLHSVVPFGVKKHGQKNSSMRKRRSGDQVIRENPRSEHQSIGGDTALQPNSVRALPPSPSGCSARTSGRPTPRSCTQCASARSGRSYRVVSTWRLQRSLEHRTYLLHRGRHLRSRAPRPCLKPARA